MHTLMNAESIPVVSDTSDNFLILVSRLEILEASQSRRSDKATYTVLDLRFKALPTSAFNLRVFSLLLIKP